jgi:rubrerythrin
MQMVLINEAGEYDDIKAVLRATRKAPPTWQVRPELRNRTMGALAIEAAHRREIEQLISATPDDTLQSILARVYAEEEVHQAMFGSLVNGASAVDYAVGAELAFISFVSTLAQIEPDELVAAFFNYLIIDHLTHTKALAEASTDWGLSGELLEEAARLPAGRAFENQFCATADLIKEPYGPAADPGTKVNIRLVRAADALVREQVENLALTAKKADPILETAREIGAVEVEHTLLLNTLIDPNETVLERGFYGELTEVMGLNRLLATEKSGDARDAYEFVVDEDEEHLRYLGAAIAETAGKDPSELSESKVFAARPRRKIENYLAYIVETAGAARLTGSSISKVA